MIDKQKTEERLRNHLQVLTVRIGERSVRLPDNLKRSQEYIESFFKNQGMSAELQTYRYRGFPVANVISKISLGCQPKKHYLLGAHYDSVRGSVGADDNASAVAVLLETARELNRVEESTAASVSVKFVAFTLEEPPASFSRHMGSRVYARNAKKEKEKIDGMIALEMVGYTCREKKCQRYPFPLGFFGFPREGNFIGIVGNFGSRKLVSDLERAFLKNPDLPVVTVTIPLAGWLVPPVRLSDHSSFWNKGYRAVMVTDSAFYRNPYYHTSMDTMEKLDYGFMAELVESLVMFFSMA